MTTTLTRNQVAMLRMIRQAPSLPNWFRVRDIPGVNRSKGSNDSRTVRALYRKGLLSACLDWEGKHRRPEYRLTILGEKFILP